MAEAGKNGSRTQEPSSAVPSELTGEYLARLAHELRNPLAPIRNAAELLRTLCSDPRQLQAIEMISRQVVSLTHLLDDVLDAAQPRKGMVALSLRTVNVAEMVEEVLSAVRPAIDARRQSLFVALPNAPVEMQCDPIRLAQVIQTLLENATRNTPEGGSVALQVREHEAQLVIEVSDNGAGIAAELLPQVFNVFAHGRQPGEHREDRPNVNLAIVRNLVEMHGGTIEAASAGVGRGSKFTLHLPLQLPQEPEQQPAPEQSAGRKILIIDDQEDSSRSLANYLAHARHSVLTAASGEVGVTLAAQFRPDVVIIDIGLPGIDGFQVGRLLRDHRDTANALLIAVSGHSMKQFRDLEAYSVFRHYLLKPTSPQSLLNIIEHTLKDVNKLR